MIKSSYSQQIFDETDVQNTQNMIYPEDYFKRSIYIRCYTFFNLIIFDEQGPVDLLLFGKE